MKNRKKLPALLAIILLAGLASQATAADKPARKKTKLPPGSITPESVDKPGLPRVLLIGDSISIGYTVPVIKLLEGKANVYRAPTNCGPTSRGLEQLDQWLGETPWEVIHFNWGLHDFKNLGNGQPNQVPAQQYGENLEKLVRRLEKTKAQLIWCSTTPVPEGAGMGRADAEAVQYNAIAAGIMKKHGIPTNDLYAFVKNHKEKLQLDRNVHFHKAGSNALAAKVAEAISAKLASDSDK